MLFVEKVSWVYVEVITYTILSVGNIYMLDAILLVHEYKRKNWFKLPSRESLGTGKDTRDTGWKCLGLCLCLAKHAPWGRPRRSCTDIVHPSVWWRWWQWWRRRWLAELRRCFASRSKAIPYPGLHAFFYP